MSSVATDEGRLLDPRARFGFGITNAMVAVAVLVSVFRFLPTRWWVVDVGAVIVALALGASGVTLLAKKSIAIDLTRIAAAIVLVLGLALFAALVLTASWISGVYGQVGAAGGIIFGLVALLVLPYIVVLPAVELAWVGPRPPKKEKKDIKKDDIKKKDDNE